MKTKNSVTRFELQCHLMVSERTEIILNLNRLFYQYNIHKSFEFYHFRS